MYASLLMYSVYDRKARTYAAPFSADSDAAAVRMFTQAVMSDDIALSQYPADFDLCKIGTFDLILGLLAAPEHIGPLVNGLVCLQNAHAERRRYQAVLTPSPDANASPEAA